MKSDNSPPTRAEVKQVLLNAVKGSLAQRPVGMSVEECFAELIMAVNEQHGQQIDAWVEQFEREKRHKLAAQERLKEYEKPGTSVVTRALLRRAWGLHVEDFVEPPVSKSMFNDFCKELHLPEDS